MADAEKIKKTAAKVLCCVEKVSSFASSIDPIFGIVSSLVGVARKGLVDEEGHALDKDFQAINTKLESISEKNQQCLRKIRIDEVNETYGKYEEYIKHQYTAFNNMVAQVKKDPDNTQRHMEAFEKIYEDLFDHLGNLRGLNLSFNSLSTLPQGIFSGLSSIVEIDLSSNALTYLQPDVFPVSLQRLDLSSNFLASPDPVTFQSLSFFSLAVNRFHCDCHLDSFLKWLNVTNVTFLSPVEEYRCEFPAALHNLPLLDYSMIVEPCEEDDEKAVQDLKFALFIFSAFLIITVIFSGIVYARLRGRIFIIYKKIVGRVLQGPKPIPPLDKVQYDAFLCFSDHDYKWVEAALLKKLDNQFSEENIFHCCFEARDFLPGEDHLSNIRDAIWGSRKTVCIVSKDFLKDGWCLEAFTLAQGRMLEELTNVLIMLVVGKVAHYQLMKYNAVRAFVQRREYLIWPEDPQDLGWFYERLVAQILKDNKVKKFAEDEPEPAQPDAPPQNEDGIQLEKIRAIAM